MEKGATRYQVRDGTMHHHHRRPPFTKGLPVIPLTPSTSRGASPCYREAWKRGPTPATAPVPCMTMLLCHNLAHPVALQLQQRSPLLLGQAPHVAVASTVSAAAAAVVVVMVVAVAVVAAVVVIVVVVVANGRHRPRNPPRGAQHLARPGNGVTAEEVQ
jgi:hypothetical protein